MKKHCLLRSVLLALHALRHLAASCPVSAEGSLYPPYPNAPEVVWEAPATGLMWAVYVEPQPPFHVAVYAQLPSETNAASSPPVGAKTTRIGAGLPYFRATNAICGPCSLLDLRASRCPLLRLMRGWRNATQPASASPPHDTISRGNTRSIVAHPTRRHPPGSAPEFFGPFG